MAKSSIHIRPIKAGSEAHNQRLKELDYVRPELSHCNSSFIVSSIKDTRSAIVSRYERSTGQKMQAKATPIREGVLLIEAHHGVADLKRLGQRIEVAFGIRTIQGYCHKDEGHWDKHTGAWKPNYHAHLIFDWTDEQTGKSIKLNREAMSQFQDIVADSLGLERGISSSKKHLNAIQFKRQAEQRELIEVHGLKNGLIEASKLLSEAEPLRKEVESLREAKKGLELENSVLRANRIYLEEQIEQKRNQNKGFRL